MYHVIYIICYILYLYSLNSFWTLYIYKYVIYYTYVNININIYIYIYILNLFFDLCIYIYSMSATMWPLRGMLKHWPISCAFTRPKMLLWQSFVTTYSSRSLTQPRRRPPQTRPRACTICCMRRVQYSTVALPWPSRCPCPMMTPLGHGDTGAALGLTQRTTQRLLGAEPNVVKQTSGGRIWGPSSCCSAAHTRFRSYCLRCSRNALAAAPHKRQSKTTVCHMASCPAFALGQLPRHRPLSIAPAAEWRSSSAPQTASSEKNNRCAACWSRCPSIFFPLAPWSHGLGSLARIIYYVYFISIICKTHETYLIYII